LLFSVLQEIETNIVNSRICDSFFIVFCLITANG
jgi:hypothetical protein